MAKEKKFTVVVAKREGHPGWYHGGKFWGTGTHEGVEMSDEDASSLAARDGIAVLDGNKAVKPGSARAKKTTQEELTEDEIAELRRYRAKRSEMAEAENAASSSTTLEYTGEKKPDAINRALSSGATGITADTPLQDSDILHGKPPPEGPGGNVKPTEVPKGKGR